MKPCIHLTCWDNLWATAGCRLLLKTVGGFVRCDCGSDVILNVEAVLSEGVVDRSVLTADVNAGLGLITCERDGVGQIARLSPWRSCAQVALISVSDALSGFVEHVV